MCVSAVDLPTQTIAGGKNHFSASSKFKVWLVFPKEATSAEENCDLAYTQHLQSLVI